VEHVELYQVLSVTHIRGNAARYYNNDASNEIWIKEANSHQRVEDKTDYAQERNIVLKTTVTGLGYEWETNGIPQKVINPAVPKWCLVITHWIEELPNSTRVL
jgi:hypothetical protein